jgi:hypothetical protein
MDEIKKPEGTQIQSKKLWFKHKTYGYGWIPATREGWAVTCLYFFLLIPAIMYIAHDSKESTQIDSQTAIAFLYIVLITIVFMIICYIKGEKLGWHWGN